VLSRNTQGVRLIKLSQEDERLVGVERIAEADDAGLDGEELDGETPEGETLEGTEPNGEAGESSSEDGAGED